MERNMWFGVGPSAHDLLHFVLCHLMFLQGDIVTEKASSELVSDENSQDRPPSNTKDHVEGNAQGSSSAHLVMSAEVVERAASGSHTIKEHAEGNVPRILLLRLREEVLVRFVLDQRALIHRTLFMLMHWHFCFASKLILITFIK